MKYDKFEILKEIDEWRREINRLEKSDHRFNNSDTD